MNYREYLLFVYIYIAYSDYKLVPSEVEVIRHNLFPHFHDDAKFNELFDQIIKLEKREIEKIISREYKNLQKAQIDIQKIFTDLEEIMESDGVVYDTEIASFDRVKSILV